MKTLRQIQDEVDRLARRIGVGKNDLPTYGSESSRDMGYAHIDVDSSQYHIVVMERGEEQSRQSTTSMNDLLYWIFESATHSMAFAYEMAHRIEDRDCRRIAFPKHIELMTSISPEMGARARQAIDDILKVYPYDDEPTRTTNRITKGNS